MNDLIFHRVNVFAEQPYTGHQLAVLIPARNLATEQRENSMDIRIGRKVQWTAKGHITVAREGHV